MEDLQTQYDTNSPGCIYRTSARRCRYIHNGFDSSWTTRLVLETEETEFAYLNPLMVIKMKR
jgi:hypothetical protein